MDRDEELALVGRLRDGDPEAFDRLHDCFNARLFSFLVRLSRRRDVAEDLLEDTWLRLVQQAGRLRADTRLGPWLFTVARNLYISHNRSRVVERSHATDLIGLWPDAPPPRSPFEDAASSERARRLEVALASLPDWAREVLLLVGVEGLKPREAAEVCGLTHEALRQRLSRARWLLAQALDPEDRQRVSILREVTS